jgi:hypothetical protein
MRRDEFLRVVLVVPALELCALPLTFLNYAIRACDQRA